MSYNNDTTVKDTVEHVLLGLAILIGVAMVLFSAGYGFYSTADNNNEKVRELTKLCLDSGYAGFQDDSYDTGQVGCYSDRRG